MPAADAGGVRARQAHFPQASQGLFDLEHHLWYLSELHVSDTVTVHHASRAQHEARHGVMFVWPHATRLASAFEYVSTGADLDARRTAPLPAAFAAQLDRMIAEDARLDWPAPVCGVMSV
jgi:hypothetical protein